MPQDDEKREKVFEATNVEQESARNENLAGGKSTQCHSEEAEEEQETTGKNQENLGREPDEIKSTAPLLPEDAEKKSELSAGDEP